MPPAAYVGGGTAASALGSVLSSKDQKEGAEQYLNTVYGPIQGTRQALGNIFEQVGQTGGQLPLLGASTPLTEAVRGRYREMITPEYADQLLLGQSPEEVLGRLDEARRPVFEANMGDTLNAINAKYGPTGHRAGASTDLYQVGAREGARGEAEYEAGLQGLYPQIQSNWTAANSLLGQILGQAGGYDLGERQPTMDLLRTFISASPQGAYPGLGASPAGAGLDAAGSGMMAYPILMSMMKGNEATP
jgi:hypothetical protein